jgi:hypothetical protein
VSQTDEVTDRLTPGSPRGKPTGPADFGEPVTLAHLDITEHDGVVQALPSATPERRWATPQLDRTGSVPLPAHGVEDHGATPGTSPSKQRRYVKQPPDLSALEAHHAPKAYPAIDDFASHLTVGDIEADVVTVEDIKADVVTVEDIEAAVVRDLQDIRVVPDLILSAVRVSVVLPTLNEAANLPYVFERMPREAHEVILVWSRSIRAAAARATRSLAASGQPPATLSSGSTPTGPPTPPTSAVSSPLCWLAPTLPKVVALLPALAVPTSHAYDGPATLH